ncbi:helix-turn-helix transcriptional regulator [Arthrobacter sp. MI7-26]|uniref:helix-turn-helix domain-containing protein n=1 Tax=Arthrobacter sp. MI7-26 TaxID=2993653 RepID=UPI0022491FBC|nr:helix-turn-helix transcriptional regulator [Arthrobacter sp. MI7-26]MCX2746853.1 helix-turn-helix transcriptional regulator [Arthrobacter sp. MI7-26]
MLGADAYVDRCSREMRASGVSSRANDVDNGAGRKARSGPSSAGSLTEQEKSVAGLVASGLSNKDAAAELYVSVKTVQYHLTRIYMKLGISSRSELAAFTAH